MAGKEREGPSFYFHPAANSRHARNLVRECSAVLWRDFRLAMLGEEIVEGFRYDAMQCVSVLDGENLQLVAHLFGKMHSDGARAGFLLWPWR